MWSGWCANRRSSSTSAGSRVVSRPRTWSACERSHVRIGVVGLGYWGPNLARNFSRLADVAWLCDASPERLERHAAPHPGARTTTPLDDLLHDGDLDAVAP